MALWPYEEAILDLLDAGVSAQDVAAHGFKPLVVTRVANTIGTADQHASGDKRRAASLHRGSQRLLRAIQRAKKNQGRAA